MGLDFGLENSSTCYFQKNRWLFKINEVSATSINSLPPLKSARPSLSYRELQVEHLNETIYYPGKPEVKPVNLVLYDLKKNKHPVFAWLKKFYNPCDGSIYTPLDNNFIMNPTLELYDGCGTLIEMWTFENAWPQSVDFGELDMASGDILTCDISLRYARAYITDECS